MSAQERWVVFDLGGVLVHVARNWGDALREAGLEFGRSHIADAELDAFTEFVAYQAGTWEHSGYLDALGRFLEIQDADEAFRVHQSILMHPFAGTEELVAQLHSLGYRTGCLSNTNAPHWDALLDPERYPAIAALQVPAASHLLGLDKPDPRIYRAYEELIGARPDQIAFFDDNAANVAAAQAVGWHAMVKSPDEETPRAVWAWLGQLGWTVPLAPNHESSDPMIP